MALDTFYTFNIAETKWIYNTSHDLNIPRYSPGCIYVEGELFVIGGYNGVSSNKVEYYDFHKNKWFQLPDTLTPHRNCCCVMVYKDCNPYFNVNEGVLMVIGDDGCGGKDKWGWIEYYDNRDGKQKWNLVEQVNECVDYRYENGRYLLCKIIAKSQQLNNMMLLHPVGKPIYDTKYDRLVDIYEEYYKLSPAKSICLRKIRSKTHIFYNLKVRIF